MRSLLTCRYDELTLKERVNAINLARKTGREEAVSDCEVAGGADQPNATPRDYFLRVVEPAWHADMIDDETFVAWRDGDQVNGDPRVAAFCQGWAEHMAEVLENFRVLQAMRLSGLEEA